MSWKPKHFMIFPRKVIHEIQWPAEWGNQCAANLSEMLREQLKLKRGIGSEIKLIWNDDHRRQLIRDFDVTGSDLEDYVRADCTMLSFRTESIMNKTIKLLTVMGIKSTFVCTEAYRDVIVKQAEYFRNKQFLSNTNP